MFANTSAEQSKSRVGRVFGLGIAIEMGTTFALFCKYVFEFAVMNRIDTYATIPRDLELEKVYMRARTAYNRFVANVCHFFETRAQ